MLDSVCPGAPEQPPLRAQGIALSSNPDYKVLGAAYPWIARRLLLDTAPELRSTLRTLLYKVCHALGVLP